MNPITNHLYNCGTAQIGTFPQVHTNVSPQRTSHTQDMQTFVNGSASTQEETEVSNATIYKTNITIKHRQHKPMLNKPNQR